MENTASGQRSGGDAGTSACRPSHPLRKDTRTDPSSMEPAIWDEERSGRAEHLLQTAAKRCRYRSADGGVPAAGCRPESWSALEETRYAAACDIGYRRRTAPAPDQSGIRARDAALTSNCRLPRAAPGRAAAAVPGLGFR